jgi:hypothetical protein
MRAIRSGILVGLGALALSGCAVFDGTPTAAQQKTIGNVAITFKVCASEGSSGPSGSCSNDGNSGDGASYDPSQLWMGFRVPSGTLAPASFTSTSTGPNDTGPQLTFTSSSAYSSELQRLEPAASGEQWAGYVSQWVNYSGTTDQNFTATADFGLPQAKNGAPFAGPFNYQLVVGGRQYYQGSSTIPTPASTEGIDCEASATQGYGSVDSSDSAEEDWICVDDQSPSTLGADATLPTRDAGIVPGKTVRVRAGKKAAAHFTFEYNGTSPGASFTLSARTTARRTKATPKPKSITPAGTSNTPVTVTVPVPANAKAGTYKVKLTAKLPDGESRSGTVKVVVKAARKAKATRKKAPSPTFTG